MNREGALQLVQALTLEWVDDATSSVVWAGAHEGRWGIRIRQEAREATTVWIDVGDLTVAFEAYLLPKPRFRREEVYRLSLTRNHRSWPAYISIDDQGDLFIRGRIGLSDLSRERIDQVIGAVYEVVEISFRVIARAGFQRREKSR